jgi:hypothetical protein
MLHPQVRTVRVGNFLTCGFGSAAADGCEEMSRCNKLRGARYIDESFDRNLPPENALRVLMERHRLRRERIVRNVVCAGDVVRRPRWCMRAAKRARSERTVEHAMLELPSVAEARDPRLVSVLDQQLDQSCGVRDAVRGITVDEHRRNAADILR